MLPRFRAGRHAACASAFLGPRSCGAAQRPRRAPPTKPCLTAPQRAAPLRLRTAAPRHARALPRRPRGRRLSSKPPLRPTSSSVRGFGRTRHAPARHALIATGLQQRSVGRSARPSASIAISTHQKLQPTSMTLPLPDDPSTNAGPAANSSAPPESECLLVMAPGFGLPPSSMQPLAERIVVSEPPPRAPLGGWTRAMAPLPAAQPTSTLHNAQQLSRARTSIAPSARRPRCRLCGCGSALLLSTIWAWRGSWGAQG